MYVPSPNNRDRRFFYLIVDCHAKAGTISIASERAFLPLFYGFFTPLESLVPAYLSLPL